MALLGLLQFWLDKLNNLSLLLAQCMCMVIVFDARILSRYIPPFTLERSKILQSQPIALLVLLDATVPCH